MPAESAAPTCANVLRSLTPAPLLHRDLKSLNLLVDARDGGSLPRLCKVADFGLATCRALCTTHRTGGDGALGTPAWCAPEVLRGSPHATSADVYSFGVVAWELLTGEWPFAQMRPLHAAHEIAHAT